MPQRHSRSSSVPATRDARHPHGPQFALTNARVRAPSNSGESHGQKDLPADRMAAIMPADGGGAHARAEANRVADQQSTPSTYIKFKLGAAKRDTLC